MAQTATPTSHLIFDRGLIRARRRRAARLGPATFLLDRVAAELAERLAAVVRPFDLVLDLGTPGGALRARLTDVGSVGTVVSTQTLPADAVPAPPLLVTADEEMLPFRDAAFDLVVSALALQFVNDLPGTLIQIRRALKPDGLFLAALLGGETLTELRQSFAAAETELEGGLSPRIAPFADLRDLGALLQRAGFALPVADVEEIRLLYASPLELLRDLRAAGETNALVLRQRRPPPRALFPAALAALPVQEGRVCATLELAVLTGWAPAPGQPRPLRPGSGRIPLGEALARPDREPDRG